MQRQSCLHSHSAEKFLRHLGIINAQLHLRNISVKNEIGAAAEIQAHLHQRLVHRQKAVAVAVNACLIANGLLERLSQHDAAILNSVMAVHIKVTLRLHREVTEAVLRQERQHMV